MPLKGHWEPVRERRSYRACVPAGHVSPLKGRCGVGRECRLYRACVPAGQGIRRGGDFYRASVPLEQGVRRGCYALRSCCPLGHSSSVYRLSKSAPVANSPVRGQSSVEREPPPMSHVPQGRELGRGCLHGCCTFWSCCAGGTYLLAVPSEQIRTGRE